MLITMRMLLLAAGLFLSVIASASSQELPVQSPQVTPEQGTEFWPPLYGYRLKITDTLLVAFTCLLFFATVALWWSTRRLVKGAEITAQRQLRAYLGVKGARIISHDGGNTFVVEIQIINSGQTPARRVTHSIAAELQVLHGRPLDFQMPNRQPGEWFMTPHTDFTFVQDIPIGGASGTGTIDVGQRTIFTWGRVDFIDAFDRPQHIEFRYQNDRPIRQHDGTVMRTVGWELEPSDQGNTCT
jgi:hypothetical protein